MTASQKIKREIMLEAVKAFKEHPKRYERHEEFIALVESGITDATVEKQYYKFIQEEFQYDFESEFREGTVETNLPCEYSRHYEARSVARKMCDGSWVGWTYWYGGGKHGNPEEIEWMLDAYNLELTETEKLVIIQEFKKVNG